MSEASREGWAARRNLWSNCLGILSLLCKVSVPLSGSCLSWEERMWILLVKWALCQRVYTFSVLPFLDFLVPDWHQGHQSQSACGGGRPTPFLVKELNESSHPVIWAVDSGYPDDGRLVFQMIAQLPPWVGAGSVCFLLCCDTFPPLWASFGKRNQCSMLEVATHVDDAVPVLGGVSSFRSAMVPGIS